MANEETQIRMVLEATDRSSLLHTIIERLRETLGVDPAWDHNTSVVPWQVTAPSFELLPERMIAAILDAADLARERYVDLELSGYLETDTGPRVWGTAALRDGEPEGPAVWIDEATVTETGAGYRFEGFVRGRGEGHA